MKAVSPGVRSTSTPAMDSTQIVSDIVQSLPHNQKTQLADRHGVSSDEIETAVLENIHVSKPRV